MNTHTHTDAARHTRAACRYTMAAALLTLALAWVPVIAR